MFTINCGSNHAPQEFEECLDGIAGGFSLEVLRSALGFAAARASRRGRST